MTNETDFPKETYEMKAKKKGRPRKTRIKASFENSTKRKCKVCIKLGFECDHLTGLCKYYQRLIEIGKQFDDSLGNAESKKCSLCKCRGHNCQKCISLAKLIEEISTKEPNFFQ